MNRILLIRFSSIGDIIFTTYALQLLNKKYPKSKIYFLTLENNKTILKNINFIHEVITIQSYYKSIEYLKANKCNFESHAISSDGHNISPEAITLLQNFIKKIL